MYKHHLTYPVFYQLCFVFTPIFMLLTAWLPAQPVSVFRVHFDLAEHQLTDSERNAVMRLAATLDTPAKYRVQLIGHTDRRGSLEYNQALSERRAASVKAALVDLGFPAGSIQMQGMAFLDPLADIGTEAAMARNRRVEVIIEAAHWNVESTYYSIPTEQATQLVYQRSGTRIQVPANAFTYPDGRPASGEVLVQYREFRDAADFIAGRIPMQLEYEGRPGYFNSTGMFEIRAYDEDGQPLILQTEARIDLDFVQTQLQEGTQFWRFNEATQTWSSGEEAVKFANPQTRKISLGSQQELLGRLNPYWPGKDYWKKHPDTIAQLQESYAKIPELITSRHQYKYRRRYQPQLDATIFDQRFWNRDFRGSYAGVHYVGHLKHRLVYKDPQYYNLVFRSVGRRNSYHFFQLQDLTGENEELKAFDDYVWRTNSSHIRRLRDIAKGTKFSDVRIRSRGTSGRLFSIQLKYRSKLISLNAFLYEKKKGMISADTAAIRYEQYKNDLSRRELAFNEQILADLERETMLWPCIRLLLSKEMTDNPFRERYLQAVLSENGKYQRLVERLIQLDSLDIKGRQYDLPGYSFLYDYGKTLQQKLTAQANPDWRRLLDAYQAEIYAEKELFIEVQEAFDDPVPRLSIGGLGIFNCDVLQRFEEKHELVAGFQDEHGRALEFSRIEVINHNLNGLLAFETNKIYLDLASPTTLIVYAKDGRIFYLSARELEKLALKDQSSFVFRLNDLGDYSGNPEVFRKLFATG